MASGRDRDRRWNHARRAILCRPSRPPKSFSVRDSVTRRIAFETGHEREGEEDDEPPPLSRRAVDSDLSRRVDELIVVFVLLPRVPESHRSSSTLDLRFEAHLLSLFPFSVVQTLVAFRSAPICFVLEIVLLKILLTKLTKVRTVFNR